MTTANPIALRPDDIAEMVEGMGSMATDVKDCLDRFNSVDLWELGALALGMSTQAIADGLIQMRDAVADIIDFVTQLLSPGNPWQLMEMSLAWETVKSQVSGHITTTSGPYFVATRSWSGRVGDAYRDLPGLQAAALTRLASGAHAFSTLLREHALALASFWGDVCSNILQAQLQLTQKVVEFVTLNPLKWIDIVPGLAGIATTALAQLIELGDIHREYILDTQNTWRSFGLDRADRTGTDEGHWPRLAIGPA